jgi:2-dehydro-3-deoxyphosphogalactonate aldolase
MPLIAILRGVKPDNCVGVTEVLVSTGYRCIEVPLNSPEPLESIKLLAQNYGEQALIGAGTVTQVEQVQQVHDAGGKLIFSPNCDIAVIKATKALNMVSIPGCATPSEAFAAIAAGADWLKLFPAQLLTPPVVKSFTDVLPSTTPLLAVGGIDETNMAAYLNAGCSGFGLGGALYKPDMNLEQIQTNAQNLLQAYLQQKGQTNDS